MTTPEMIFIGFIVALQIVHIVTVKYQSKTICIYKKMISKSREDTSEILKYCLTRIMNDSAQNEDYDTAKRCYDLLQKLKD